MQSICAYEYNYLYSSDFCTLFTLPEWQGFEATLEIEYYVSLSNLGSVCHCLETRLTHDGWRSPQLYWCIS